MPNAIASIKSTYTTTHIIKMAPMTFMISCLFLLKLLLRTLFRTKMKAKIIIVEDHEPIRNELKILLSKYGYEIIVLDRFDTVVAVSYTHLTLPTT